MLTLKEVIVGIKTTESFQEETKAWHTPACSIARQFRKQGVNSKVLLSKVEETGYTLQGSPATHWIQHYCPQWDCGQAFQ